MASLRDLVSEARNRRGSFRRKEKQPRDTPLLNFFRLYGNVSGLCEHC
jgi:hypothetical protein